MFSSELKKGSSDAPALLATRLAISPALRAGVAAEIGGQLRLRRVLVTAQLALSLVLVMASGLFGVRLWLVTGAASQPRRPHAGAAAQVIVGAPL